MCVCFFLISLFSSCTYWSGISLNRSYHIAFFVRHWAKLKLGDFFAFISRAVQYSIYPPEFGSFSVYTRLFHSGSAHHYLQIPDSSFLRNVMLLYLLHLKINSHLIFNSHPILIVSDKTKTVWRTITIQRFSKRCKTLYKLLQIKL